MPIYAIWFVAGLALLVLELASTTFFSIFLAVGAFAAGVLAFVLPDSAVWFQAVVAIAVAMVGVVLVRPFVSKRLRRRGDAPLTPGVHGGFVGQRALALDEIGEELHPGPRPPGRRDLAGLLRGSPDDPVRGSRHRERCPRDDPRRPTRRWVRHTGDLRWIRA